MTQARSSYSDLNGEQQKAVEAVEGPVLVLAGAGSGKTRVLTHRIAHMVNDCGILPSTILAITFTNKAAQEMKDRLYDMHCNAERMTISTIHSMCARILRKEAVVLGYTPAFSIYTDVDSDRLLKRILQDKRIEDEKLRKQLPHHVSQRKNEGLTYEAYADAICGNPDADLITDLMKEYDRRLLQANAMDFDDLLLNTHKLFSEQKDVLERYQDRFRYISIDEFQDTNRIQYEIFQMLAAKYHNLFVVGDDDQSIYGWRGADVRNLLDFKKDFPDVKIFKLEQNYRSTKKILAIANEVIGKNKNRYQKSLWTQNEDGVRVETFAAYSETEEAEFVAQQISALQRSGASYSDFAVLVRVNALTRGFEQAFLSYGIPYKVYGGFKFFERKEVKDLIAYLNLIVNSVDNEAFYRVINVPKRGIGDTTIQKIRTFAEAKNCSAYEVLLDENCLNLFSKVTKQKLIEFVCMIGEMQQQAKEKGVAAFVQWMVNRAGLRAGYGDSDEEQNRVMNIDEFIQSVCEYAAENPEADLVSYLQTAAVVSDVDLADKASGNVVTLATIHAVKGLEFPTVFVSGMEESVFPITRALYEEYEMSEERRLMYVAVTRACERLYLTHSRSRFLYGERKSMAPSRFFREVEQFKTGDAVQNKEVPDTNIKNDPAAIEKLRPGTKVVHTTFGEGVVLSNQGGVGQVSFSSVGIKTLAFKFAPLKVIS